MKYYPLIITSFSAVFSSCAPKAVNSNELASQGFTPYNPQQGNPGNLNSWNLRGPGTILRTARYEVDYGAKHVIGDELMKRVFEDANDPQTKVPFAALSNTRTTGGTLGASGGWNINGVADIKSSLDLSGSSTYDIKFGDTWVTELTAQDFRSASGVRVVDKDTRTNLRKGRCHLILKTVYTDSLKIYFKDSKDGGGSAAVKIPLQDEIKLGGKYKVTNDGGVEVSGPIMIGYVPVSKDTIQSIFPKK